MSTRSIASYSLLRLMTRLVSLCLLLLLAPVPVVYAANINVDDGCSLANAIRSAQRRGAAR